MATIYDVDTNELIDAVAEELKKIDAIQPPEWAPFVKTGVSKERPPVNKDWWYMRTASVLRKVTILGPIGVSKLRTKYGGKKNCGYRPERFYRASGNIIRKILQQLEKAELIKKKEKDIHKGRIIAPKGKSLLDKTATRLLGKKPKIKKEIKEEVTEKKNDDAGGDKEKKDAGAPGPAADSAE